MVTLQTSPPVGAATGDPSASPIVIVAGLNELIRITVAEVCNVANLCDDVARRVTLPLKVSVVNSGGAVGELSQPAKASDTRKRAANRGALVIFQSRFSVCPRSGSAPTRPGRINGASGIRSNPTSFQPSAMWRKYACIGAAHEGCVAPGALISTRMNRPPPGLLLSGLVRVSAPDGALTVSP